MNLAEAEEKELADLSASVYTCVVGVNTADDDESNNDKARDPNSLVKDEVECELDNENDLLLDNTDNECEIKCEELKIRGHGCNVFSCTKRRPYFKRDFQDRSDSKGEDDEESLIKRMFPRSFHR